MTYSFTDWITKNKLEIDQETPSLDTWLLDAVVDNHCVYMLEHNRVMNVSNQDWINVNRFIWSASPKGSSQDRISEADRIAGLEPVLVGYLPARVLDRIVLPGVRVPLA